MVVPNLIENPSSATGGGVSQRPNRVVAASGALLVTDSVVLANAAGGALVLSLPDPALYSSKTITVKKTDTTVNTVTVTPFAAETIDGLASFVLSSSQESVDLYSNGVNWFTV